MFSKRQLDFRHAATPFSCPPSSLNNLGPLVEELIICIFQGIYQDHEIQLKASRHPKLLSQEFNSNDVSNSSGAKVIQNFEISLNNFRTNSKTQFIDKSLFQNFCHPDHNTS